MNRNLLSYIGCALTLFLLTIITFTKVYSENNQSNANNNTSKSPPNNNPPQLEAKSQSIIQPKILPLNLPITLYTVPTRKSEPHDPAYTADGRFWFTEKLGNRIGYLNIKTKQIKEYALKTENSGPHGIAVDKEGNIWFTAIDGGYIGKLNPKTGEVVEYKPLGDTKLDPHTPVFDQNGILWFTNESTNIIGRLYPDSGKIDLIKLPTPGVKPYGIVITKDNIPFFCEFGTNKLGSIDPTTLTVKEYTLPAQEARPRRLALSSNGMIYFTDFARGYLGLFDPASGQLIKEWPSPGGENSEPYGIAITKDDVVYYSESGVTPNTLVRFDPKSETFNFELIQSKAAAKKVVIRNMLATPNNLLFMPLSEEDKLATVNLNPQP